MEKKNGFTILEMMIVMLIVALLLLITLPNIQQKEKIIRNKGCEALLEIVNSQIMLYEIDQLETPTSVQELIDFGYYLFLFFFLFLFFIVIRQFSVNR